MNGGRKYDTKENTSQYQLIKTQTLSSSRLMYIPRSKKAYLLYQWHKATPAYAIQLAYTNPFFSSWASQLFLCLPKGIVVQLLASPLYMIPMGPIVNWYYRPSLQRHSPNIETPSTGVCTDRASVWIQLSGQVRRIILGTPMRVCPSAVATSCCAHLKAGFPVTYWGERP